MTSEQLTGTVMQKQRNRSLDYYKGLLIVLVVIRHVLQYSVSDEGGILTNLIWAVQMPGFMLVSGYFSARKIAHFRSLRKSLINSLERYLLPFLSWFVLIYVLLLGGYERNPIDGLFNLFQRVDIGLWFLWVIFVLSLVTAICNWIIAKSEKLVLKVINVILLCGVLFGSLLTIGILTTLDFMGIKLILYYSIFYGFGWLAKTTDNSWKIVWWKYKNTVYFTSIVVFFTIVYNHDLYHSNDDLVTIILRMVSGFAGNLILLSLVNKYEILLDKIKMDWIGKYTLEIYTSHMLVNNLFTESNQNSFYSTVGFINFVASMICTVIFTAFIVATIKSTPVSNYLMFGKKNNSYVSTL